MHICQGHLITLFGERGRVPGGASFRILRCNPCTLAKCASIWPRGVTARGGMDWSSFSEGGVKGKRGEKRGRRMKERGEMLRTAAEARGEEEGNLLAPHLMESLIQITGKWRRGLEGVAVLLRHVLVSTAASTRMLQSAHGEKGTRNDNCMRAKTSAKTSNVCSRPD